MAARVGNEFGKGRSVAQPEIEPLRTDRRNDVRGFAHKRNPVSCDRTRCLNRQRKHAAPGLDTHFAEQRMRAALDLDGELRVGLVATRDARFGSSTQTRLERRPGRETSVNGPVSV